MAILHTNSKVISYIDISKLLPIFTTILIKVEVNCLTGICSHCTISFGANFLNIVDENDRANWLQFMKELTKIESSILKGNAYTLKLEKINNDYKIIK